jgi:hypothetical protein
MQLSRLCEEGQELVDALAAANPDLDSAPACYCLLHIWERLRIWAPGMEQPQQHPFSKPPSLFMVE